jgi:TonB family protein
MFHSRRFLAICIIVTAATAASSADDLNRELRDRYSNQTLIVRGFYSGDHLHYDSSGSLVSGNPSGDWTADGFVQISEIQLKGHEVRVKATRLSAVSQNKTFSLRIAENENVRPGENKVIVVEIAADLGTRHPSVDQLNEAVDNIFLSSKDDFSALMPDYWKPCVLSGLAGKESNCRFDSEMLGVPGLKILGASSEEIASAEQKARNRIFRVGKGISPPKLTLHKEPEFSELARRMKYQGTGVIGLTVSPEGLPTDLHVLNPLGCGLDAQAVRAVQGWRFKPAEKDGQPVSVEIAVEVDFHLY